MRLALDHQKAYAKDLVRTAARKHWRIACRQLAQHRPVNQRRHQHSARTSRGFEGENWIRWQQDTRDLLSLADSLVEKSVWIVGGDGWAYDIGYGGLDHVLASGQNVNILVLDTEVYSNTGGQASKATPLGAVAKFATGGKTTAKKDLGMTAMRYGDVYIAQVAMGANDTHTIKAFLEAEAHPGPSLIIAYSQCIAHGIDMAKGMHQQKLAVDSGYWPLYRYNPRLVEENKNPFQLDSSDPKISLQDYIYTEGRYRMLQQSEPAVAKFLLGQAQKAVARRWQQYKQLAETNPQITQNVLRNLCNLWIRGWQ